MGNSNLDRLIKKVLKEAPIEYGDYPERMHPITQQRIEDPEGIYATNRAFRGGVRDVERMTEKRFKEIVDYVKRYYGTESNVSDDMVRMAIYREQQLAIATVMSLEPQYREQLRNLGVELAAKEEGWLPFNKTMDQAIQEGIVTKKRHKDGGTVYEFDFVNLLTFLGEKRISASEFRMKAEQKKKLELPPNFSFDIDELTPDEQRELEIEKRNVINALIQGKGKRGQFAYQMVKNRLDDIDPRLYPLYNKIMGANDLMYFTDEQFIEMLGGNAAGSAGKMDSDDDDENEGGDEESEPNDTYFANGLIFPVFLHELFKAFSIIPSREQWRGMDPSMAMDVMGQTDTMKNEPMNFRVGAELVRKMRTLLPDELTMEPEGKKYIPYFDRIVYGLPAKQFLDLVGDVVSDNERDNQKASRRFEEILQQSKEQYRQVHSSDDYDYEEDEDESYY